MTSQQIAEAMQFSFDESLHIYKRADGVIVPSVTDCIAEGGIQDLSRVPKYHLDRKAEIGKRVHLVTRQLDEGTDAEFMDDIAPYVDAYINFVEDERPKWELIEKSFVAGYGNLWFGGTIDRYGVMDGRSVLVDLKTSAKWGRHWGVQLSGYEYGLHRVVDRKLIVHLLPDSQYDIYEFSDKRDWDAFVGALTVTHWKRAQ